MNRDAFVNACKASGLRLSKDGTLKDMLCSYGIAEEDTLSDMDRAPYDFCYEDIDSIEYDPDTRNLVLRLIDKSKVRIKGEFEHDDDGAIIINTTKMPKEQSELDDLFEVIYPDLEDKLYYDILTEQGMVDPSLFNVPEDALSIETKKQQKGRFMPYNDDMVPFYYDTLERRLRGLGFTGKCPTDKVRDMVLKKKFLEHKRNLFLEWVKFEDYDGDRKIPLKWDGKPRVRRWFWDGLGARAPALMSLDDQMAYVGDATENWFKAIIMRMYREGKSEVVPVLIGGEGMGKGNFLKFTLGYHLDWFMDTSASLEGPGQEEKFLDGIKGCVIVELSESTQFATVKGTELLKTFVSKTRDKRRKAYAREVTLSIRRFNLIATSNRNNIFLDVGGGTRRYFPFYCDPNHAIIAFDPNNHDFNIEEVRQLWAEAHEMFMESPDKDPFPTQKAAELAAIMQEYGTVENTNVNKIDVWLNDELNGLTEVGSIVTEEEIYWGALGISLKDAGVVPIMATQIYREWTNIQKCWRKLPKTFKIKGKAVKNAFERIYTEEDLGVKRRANMVNVVPGQEKFFIDVKGIMRERAAIYQYSKFDDYFPTDGLSMEQVGALCDEGYIYQSSDGKYYVFRMP